MLSSALLSTFHLLALAIGLPAVVLRGRALRAIDRDATAIERVLQADTFWGVAALLWLSTGLLRAFGSFEKGSGYYLHSGLFVVKLSLFALVFVLELWPMVTFIQWRIAKAKGVPLNLKHVATLARLNTAEVVLTLLMPFCASMMARGIGFGWF